jgi:ribonuclease BN (tRNA processing enzyme)
MATELVLLGTAGAPLPVAGRAGISSALIADNRVFVIDCGRDGLRRTLPGAAS